MCISVCSVLSVLFVYYMFTFLFIQTFLYFKRYSKRLTTKAKKNTNSTKYNNNNTMKAAVHSVLFLCALCVLIFGGVSFALQDKKTVVEKAKAAREVVDAAKVLAEKVREANKDFTKNITEIVTLFTEATKGVRSALRSAGRIAKGTPNKFFAFKNITDMNANITEAQTAVTALKNAEAASLKAPNKANIDKNLKAVGDEMVLVENALREMTDDDASINKVVQKAEELEKVAQEAVTFWTSVEKSVKSQKDAAGTAVRKIKEAITEVAELIEYVGKNKDAKAVDAQNTLEKDVKAKLTTLLDKAEKIQAASIQAHTNAQALKGKYETVQTEVDELEQAAKGDNKPTGSSSFLTGPLLSITFSVFFLCLCVLPLPW